MEIIGEKLPRQGDRVDLVLTNGKELKGWYLYDAACGYFTKDRYSQCAGFIYSESVAKVSLNTI